MDFLADLCILVLCQLSLSRLSMRRLALAFFVLALCTLFIRAMNLESHWIVHIPILILGASISTGETRLPRILEACACMLCASAAIAGFTLAFSGSRIPILAATLLFAYLLRKHRHIHFQWNVELEVEMQGLTVSFPALIDTGNRLHEHNSALPVLIIEESAVPELAKLVESLQPCMKHTLPYGVLGSSGKITCFHPDRVEIFTSGCGHAQAPDCMAAIYPGRIPGLTRALAPPEFAQAVHDKTFTTAGIQQSLRRINHVIFKRKAIHLRACGSNSQGFGLLHRRQ